jgi:PAS domain S-box-containing protein
MTAPTQTYGRNGRPGSAAQPPEGGCFSGGEVGALLRGLDWSASPLGPVAGWPSCLQTSVGLCLGSRFPALVCWGPEHALIYNDACRRLLGPAHPSALGLPCRDGWPAAWPVLGPILEEVGRTGQPASRSGLTLARIDHDLSCSPIRDEFDAVGGLFVLLVESVAQRRSAHALESYRPLLQHIRDIVLVIEFDGRIADANEAALSAYGYSLAELMALSIFDLRDPTTAAEIPAQLVQAREAGISFETRHRRKDGTTFPVEVSSRGTPLFDLEGGERLLLSIIRDISERKKAEKELRASEERFRDLFENAEDTIYTLDLKGCLTSINRRGEEMFGYRREDFLERGIGVVVPPEYHQRMHEALRRKMGGETPTTYELEIIRKDGSRIPVEVSSRLIIQDGVPIGIQGIARDISARRRAEREIRRSERRFRKLFEQSPLSIQLLAPDGRTQDVNQAWERAWGTRGEMDLECYNLRHDERLAAWGVAELVERAFTGEAVELPPVGFMPPHGPFQGQRRWVRAFLYPLKDETGQVEEVVLIHEDITEKRQAEEALRASEERLRLALDAGRCGVWDWDVPTNKVTRTDRIFEFYGIEPAAWDGRIENFFNLIHPEDANRVIEAVGRAVSEGAALSEEFRVVQPCGAVRWIATSGRVLRDEAGCTVRMLGAAIDVTERRAAEEALREADRRKDEFLAMLAHELRNPLAPIRTAAQILRMIGPVSPEAEQARDVIERQVAHMARLVDDLLDVSRISRGKILLRKKPLDLISLVRATVEDHRSLLEGTGLKVEVALAAGALPVEGDPTRLAQVVGNLLHNAHKFTDAGGRVVVRLEAAAGEAIITVRDTGIGMEADILRRLFEPFSQADRSLDRSRGGLGLGLALVKGLVELHGGSVQAGSPGPGQGSEFRICLPLNQQSSAAEGPKPARPKRGRSLRILIIEDNHDAAESLRLLLTLSGHAVSVAYTGAAGVELARAGPDVVLCDIGLPGGMDGYAVARTLRADQEFSTLPLIALSGYGQEEDQRLALQAGFDRHLTKPVDPSVLASVLEAVPGRAAGMASSEGMR